jgi:glutamyl-tRNA synthetase
MKELTELFTVERVNSSPARFDMKKLEAINGDKIRALSIEEFLERSLPFLLRENVISGNENEVSLVKQALPIIQERIIKLSEVVPMLSFLFKKKLEFDEETKKKIKESDSQKVLKSALASIEALNDWSHTRIEEALRKSLLDELGLKPRIAFGPVRIALTGSPISPPLFESMELLGREVSLQRLREAID